MERMLLVFLEEWNSCARILAQSCASVEKMDECRARTEIVDSETLGIGDPG